MGLHIIELKKNYETKSQQQFQSHEANFGYFSTNNSFLRPNEQRGR